MPGRAFIDLHCHTRGSFDSLSDPAAVLRAALGRGLTHLAITDHDRIEVALRARDAAPAGLTVIVGSEVRTRDGDLICLFLERPIPAGLPAVDAIALAREQGGLVGIPHPFDRFRGSLLNDPRLEAIADRVDWVEAWNARLIGHGNERAAEFALAHGLPAVAVSDAHTTIEVGVAYTVLEGDPSTAAGLLRALPSAALVPGRASYVARLLTPVAKLVQRRAAMAEQSLRDPMARGLGWIDDRRPDAAAGCADRRPGHRRPALARPAPSPAAHDRVDHPAHRPAGAVQPGPARVQARGAAGVRRRVEQAPAAGGARRVLCRLPVARSALGRPHPGTGFGLRVRDSTEIIFISWLVNCLVPAKLGDVYRAYLLKINSPVSLSRTFGTVFIERILDLFAIVVLGLASGFISFRKGLPPQVQLVFAIGVIVVIVLAVGLLSMRNFGRRIIIRLPLPHQVVELYDRFEEGVFSAVGLRSLPGLVVLTGLIWSTEAFRLYLVIRALGFADVEVGPSGAFFVALTGSLLTAVPLTPAGIGVVEAGVVAV